MDRILVRRQHTDGNQPDTYKPLSLDQFAWPNMTLPSPFPTETAWTESSTLDSSLCGQVSPLGRMDTGGNDHSTVPTAYSATSSCESWTSGATDYEDGERNGNWEEWEQESDSVQTIPKIEPVDDDASALASLGSAPLTPNETHVGSSGVKRPRGRPRKNPVPAPANGNKVTKGRSKTGCITCRKRKKKCDEAKPGCMNCEKNSVLCEGYNEKQIWRSGKERAEEGRIKREAFPLVTLPPVLHGIETPEDKIFFGHYIHRLSNVLTVESDTQNSFKNILLNLATEHQGLLHSILSISSKHIDITTPYGASLLQQYPSVSESSFADRVEYHRDAAWDCLQADMGKSHTLSPHDPETQGTLAALYGQMLCLVLRTLIEGNRAGEHRIHLRAYQSLIQQAPLQNSQLHAFFAEFFQYHIYADDILWHPEGNKGRISLEESGHAPTSDAPCLLGVTDGLFRFLREITTLRNKIRSNRSCPSTPAASYVEMHQATDIQEALQSWSPNWQSGDSRDKAGELYRLSLWIYMFRTVYPPAPSSSLDSFAASSSIMGFMGERRCSIASSSGQVSNGHEERGSFDYPYPYSNNPSRTNSMHEEDGLPTPAPTQVAGGSSRPPSPPPSRRPSQDDKRVTSSIVDAINILASFDADDKCQTLLLIPCLLLGTACFDATQHPRIRAAVRAVRNYTGLRNADRVQEVLDETWALMERGDWAAVWDWQAIARCKGLDFLCT